MKKIFIVGLLCVLSGCWLLSFAQSSPITVHIAPDHESYIYKEGDPVKFKVTILRNDIPLKNSEVRCEISEDMMPPSKVSSHILKDGTLEVNARTMSKAGFLRCHVYAKYEGCDYSGVATVGFSPNKIKPVTKQPDDFLEFWNKAKENASKVDMDTRMYLVPENCTQDVDVYYVNLQNYEPFGRLYGVLTIPKAKGKYPVVLKVPGAGIRPYQGDVWNARRGFIIFEIGIHGIPVNLPNEVYWNLQDGALKNYYTFNLDNRDKYYYKRVYLGCVRAVDFIFSLPQFDDENLVIYGGSQGGALSIITAGLDSRVKGLVSFYPALCDLSGYLYDRAGGWPHMFAIKENRTSDKIETAKYFDVVNFSRQIKVPGFYSFGYNDMVCPPTTVFSAINVIDAPKEIMIEERTAHYTYPEQEQAAWQWITNFFNQKSH